MMMVKRTVCGGGGELVDTDQEGTGSSAEEMDCSPRSVLLPITKNKVGRNRIDNHIAGSHSRGSSSNRCGTTTTSRNSVGDGLYLLHSQIRRIRDEDTHIGEDIHADVILNLFAGFDNNKHEVGLMTELSRRPAVLPASPLSTGNSTSAVQAAD